MLRILARLALLSGATLGGQLGMTPRQAVNVVSRGQVMAALSRIETAAGRSDALAVEQSGHVHAVLHCPWGIALDHAGNLYIADSCDDIVQRIDHATGIITTVAGVGSAREHGIHGNGDGGLATEASLCTPVSLAFDAADDLYIADDCNAAIRRVDHETGIITTVVGTGRNGYSGNGGPATAPPLGGQSSIAFDTADDLYISDSEDNVLRRVDHATGRIAVVAGTGKPGYSGDGGPATSAKLNVPAGVALDDAGNIYFADSSNNVVRRIDHATNIITTIAGTGYVGYGGDGGRATAANLDVPTGVAIDDSGNLYIADTVNCEVRRIDYVTGIITTVAGTFQNGYSGDNGPATAARLAWPEGVAVDTAGNLYIGDLYNDVIRRVDHSTGIITTMAGTGTRANSAAGGPTATPLPTETPMPMPTPVPQARVAGYALATDLVRRTWLPGFAVTHPAVALSFMPGSSADGAAALLSGSADLALRDGPLTPSQSRGMAAACGGHALHLPVALAATTLVYDLPGVRAPLHLSPSVVSDLWLGRIHAWNDARITALNPGVRLPALPVGLFVRGDGSRESAALHAYLAETNPARRTAQAANGAWPAGTRVQSASAMARAVLGTPGALGYLDLPDARHAPLAMAALAGATGRYIAPSPDSASAAAARSAKALLAGQEQLVLSGSDAPNAYPLSSAIVADLCAPGASRPPMSPVFALARYLLTAGQAVLRGAGYGALPARVRLAALAALGPGASATMGSAAPTPTP